MATMIVILLICVGIVMMIWVIVDTANKDKAIKLRRKAEAEAEAARLLEERRKAYETEETAVRAELGDPDKVISWGKYDRACEVRAYAKAATLVLAGRRCAFGDILGCSLTDNASVRRGKMTINLDGDTDTDTLGVIGRAAVGGVIGGVGGALVGGLTASSSSTTTGEATFGDDTTIHDLTVWVKVRDLSSPVVELRVGGDTAAAQQIVALVELITERNRA